MNISFYLIQLTKSRLLTWLKNQPFTVINSYRISKFRSICSIKEIAMITSLNHLHILLGIN